MNTFPQRTTRRIAMALLAVSTAVSVAACSDDSTSSAPKASMAGAADAAASSAPAVTTTVTASAAARQEAAQDGYGSGANLAGGSGSGSGAGSGSAGGSDDADGGNSGSASGSGESDSCAVPGGASAAVSNAIAQIAPPDSVRSSYWVPDGQSNLDGCSDLSYASLTINGATGSSPDQLLLFHRGVFQGTGIKCDVAFQDITGSTSNSVSVDYRYIVGDEPNASPQGSAPVRFVWNGSSVEMEGTLPDQVTFGKC